ncbi:MAG TPA: hypothetical protein PKC69_03625, partial [Chitinophagaceae bacterium]|nr:hypothetical protein [Chitinophagaceae bacterium]
IRTGRDPVKPVSTFIASGVFGPSAFSGGAVMIVAGLLLHYLVAFLFTVFFFFLCKRWQLLSRSWIVTGIVYGIFIWVVMNLVVVPLSRVPAMPPGTVWNKITAALILITMIGLPLAYIAHRYRKPARNIS